MSLKVTGSGSGRIPGAEILQRFYEYRLLIETNAGDAITGLGIPRGQHDVAPTVMWTPAGPAGGITVQVVGGRRIVRLGPVDNTTAASLRFRRPGPTLHFLDGGEAIPPTTSAAPGLVTSGLYGFTTSLSAWVKKVAAGDVPTARFWLGFGVHNPNVNIPRATSRVGLMGDGVAGFRFGSLHCPDAISTGALDEDNAGIDANGVQPAELVNPGTSWFHARVKMIPPIDNQTGRVACYLNGRLVATYTLLANLPRGSNGVNRDFAAIEAMITSYPREDTIGTPVPPTPPSTDLYDVRVWQDTDYSV